MVLRSSREFGVVVGDLGMVRPVLGMLVGGVVGALSSVIAVEVLKHNRGVSVPNSPSAIRRQTSSCAMSTILFYVTLSCWHNCVVCPASHS